MKHIVICAVFICVFVGVMLVQCSRRQAFIVACVVALREKGEREVAPSRKEGARFCFCCVSIVDIAIIVFLMPQTRILYTWYALVYVYVRTSGDHLLQTPINLHS